MQTAIDPDTEHLGRFKTTLWIVGVGTLILGVLAIIFPLAASLAAELLFGGVLLALGILQVGRAVLSGDIDSRLWVLVFGLLSLLAGVILLLFPLQGVVTLTILVASYFIMGGVLKLAGAWQLSPPRRRKNAQAEMPGSGWLALSGAVSLLLGLVLFFGLPSTAIWALGLLIGIDLALLGASEIALAVALSSSEQTTTRS
ncbi:MAG: HdeD family acid-resistance protein [Pelagibaca sp.]